MALMFGCAKEEKQMQLEPSEFINEYEGYFVKDLLVYDENNVNSAYFRVYSEDENMVNEYINDHRFSLCSLDENEVEEFKKTAIEFDEISTKTGSDGNDEIDLANYIMDGPVITIELVTQNISDQGAGFFLKVEKKEANISKNYVPGYEDISTAIRYSSNSPHSFLGVFSLLDPAPYWPLAEAQYRWNNRWEPMYSYGQIIRQILGLNNYHARLANSWGFSRVAFLMRRHLGATHISHYESYRIAFEWNDYRGRHCEIGKFDSRNCYVATAPAGSTAFMYPNNMGHLYYTPLSGNQCPLPGSYFDSVNCWVAKIPNHTTGFIIDQKHMYVRPQPIALDLPLD